MAATMMEWTPANPVRSISVVGAGPAGMTAALVSASRGHKVRLFDPNGFAGKKLNITGKGRCNVTNDCDLDTFFANVVRNGRFLYSSVSGFTPQDTMALLEELGVPLVMERGRRVFPQPGVASDVTKALTRRLSALGVHVEKDKIVSLDIDNDQIRGLKTVSGAHVKCDAVIVATGGLSYPRTGSTGDGFRLAVQAGHTVVPCLPSLVPIETEEAYAGGLEGLSLRNVRLKAVDDAGRVLFQDLGEMLFTDFGVSGPLVLSASAYLRQATLPVRLWIDLKPGLDEKKLDARLLRDLSQYTNRMLAGALVDLLHKRMIPVIIGLSGISPECRAHSVTKEQRRVLLTLIKNFPLTVSRPRPMDEAVVTSGGVAVSEVDPRTMASKKVRGLYWAGEVLDVDALTGGFNLQIAWSTGVAVGRYI